jgi:small-conductance mechanosensitive channel
MKPLLLAVLLACCWLMPARAQIPGLAAAKPAAAAPAPPPALTPAQAQAVLDVLQNDAKRTQFIAVLQNMAKVQAAVAPKAAGIPLAPGSLGAELITAASSAIGRASGQGLATIRTLTNFPQFYAWASHTLRDPASQALLIDAGWKAAVLALAGGGVQWLSYRGLARWRLAPRGVELQEADPEPAAEGDEVADGVRPAKPTSWALLRRVPYALLHLLIDLAPVAAFAVTVYALLATPLGAAPQPRVLLLGLLNAVIAFQVIMAVIRMVLAPTVTELRLVHMSDFSASYLTRWAARFFAVAIFGYAVDQIGLLFGMDDEIHDAAIKLTALVIHVFALIVVLQCRRRVARKLRAPKGAHGPWAVIRNRIAEVWHVVAIFYIVAFWLVFAFEVRNGYAVMWHYFVTAAVTLGLARLASIVLLGGLDRMLRLRPETVARYPGLDSRADHYHPALRLLINVVIAAAAVFVLLQVWGVPVTPWVKPGSLGSRILHAIVTSGVVVLLAIGLWEGFNAAMLGHLERLTQKAQLARTARLRTLLPMLRTTLLVVIFVFAALMVLNQIGINTAPLLAGAGVIGIAVGFGSQKLVQDVITGLFLLLENTMQVGDTVSLAGLTGTVENLSIRTIRLRALDGAVHMIPFSAVTTVTNATRDYGYAVLDVTAGYNEEPDHISEVLRAVAEELRADPDWQAAFEGDIDIQGVDKFLDNAWVLRARIKTTPSKRLPVQREFNRRLKYRFDQLAIESPFTSPRILSTNPPPPEETVQ